MGGPRDPLPGGPIERSFSWPEELQSEPEPDYNSWPWFVAAGAALVATIVFLATLT